MPRNKYPEQTVEKILDAAAALFAEKGYQSTTLQDIIDATGLSKGAVYHHFRSKEEIARKVGDRMGDEMWEPLRRIREAAGLTGLQKLQAVFAMSFAGDRQQRMGRTLPHLTDDPYFLVLEWQSIEERLVPECIAPLVRQGVADGSIHTGDPDALAGALFFLADLWLPPQSRPTTRTQQRARNRVFQQMTRALGLDLLTEEQALQLEELYRGPGAGGQQPAAGAAGGRGPAGEEPCGLRLHPVRRRGTAGEKRRFRAGLLCRGAVRAHPAPPAAPQPEAGAVRGHRCPDESDHFSAEGEHPGGGAPCGAARAGEGERSMNYFWAFCVGGGICVVGQLLIDLTGLTPARILTGYVVAGVVLSAIGWYAPLAEFAGCGATVPLLGFGHLLAKGVRTALEEEGAVGILTGGLTAAAAGITTSLVCGVVCSWVGKSHDQN